MNRTYVTKEYLLEVLCRLEATDVDTIHTHTNTCNKVIVTVTSVIDENATAIAIKFSIFIHSICNIASIAFFLD